MTKGQSCILGYVATWCCGLFLGALFWGGTKAPPPAEVPAPVVVSQPFPAEIAVTGREVASQPAHGDFAISNTSERALVQPEFVVHQVVEHVKEHGMDRLDEYCEKLINTSRTDDPLLRVEMLRGRARAIDSVKKDDPRVLQLQQEACAAIDDARMLLLRMRMDCYTDYARSLERSVQPSKGMSTDKLLAALVEVLRCYDEAGRAPLSAAPSRVEVYRDCVNRYKDVAELYVSWMTKEQRNGLYLQFNAMSEFAHRRPNLVLDLGAVGNTRSEEDEFEFYKWCQNYIAEQDKLGTPDSAKASQTASDFLKLLEPIVKAPLRNYVESETFQAQLRRHARGEPYKRPGGPRFQSASELAPYLKKDSKPTP